MITKFMDKVYNLIVNLPLYKRIVIFLVIILFIFIIPVLIIANNRNKEIDIVGVYAEFDNGEKLFVNIDHIIKLTDNFNYIDFSTGDAMQLTVKGEIGETFPNTTTITKVKKLNDGSIKNIPPDIIQAFKNINYILIED